MQDLFDDRVVGTSASCGEEENDDGIKKCRKDGNEVFEVLKSEGTKSWENCFLPVHHIGRLYGAIDLLARYRSNPCCLSSPLCFPFFKRSSDK